MIKAALGRTFSAIPVTPSRRALGLAVTCALCWLAVTPRPAHALGGPAPGAVSAQTVKLPSGPGSVRGLADDASVSAFTGQVQYAVPLELPKGPGGFAPALSLGYAGELGNGPLGVGWTLSQVGVRRSLRLGVPAYDASDVLELVGLPEGGELVLLPDGTYRVEGQGNAVVARALNGGFEVVTADGTTYRLGTSSAGRKGSKDQVSFWYLQEMQNVAGQQIQLSYQQAGGEVYLSELSWGPVVGSAAAYRAELVYQDRADAVVSYRTGFRVETARRLQRIDVWAFDRVQRRVELGYDGAFPLTRLAQVRVTSADGLEALPTLAFEYAVPGGAAVTSMTGTGGWALNLSGTSLFDVDDDGVMDLLRLTSSGHSYRRNLGGAFDVARVVPGADGASLSNVRLLDLTGDSGAEMVWQQGTQWKVFQLAATGVADRSWTAMGNWPGAQSLPLSSVAVADLDGDYRMDVLSVSGSSVGVRLGTEAGLAAPVLRPAIDPLRSYIAPGNSATSFPDINGDGLADVVYLSASAMFLYLGKGDGQFERYRDVPYPWSGAFDLSQIRLGDLNRDGLLDLAIVRAGNVAWYRGAANGTVATTSIDLARPPGTDSSVVVAVADANGNGSEDLVWSSAAGLWVLDFAGPTSAGMLTAIDNGLGQRQAFGYAASAQLALTAAAAGAPWSTRIPVSIPVTVQARSTLASGGPARSQRLDVRDGVYDRVERRFLGFTLATVTRPDPADGAPPAQQVRRVQQFLAPSGVDRVLRGRLASEELQDGTGVVLRATTYGLTTMAVEGLPASEPRLRRAIMEAIKVRHAEGAGPSQSTYTAYQYDPEGRQIEELRSGRVDLVGDESLVRRRYTEGRSARGVRDLMCEEWLLEVPAEGGELELSHTQILYGDEAQQAPLCDAATGWQREKRQYLQSEARWLPVEQAQYDALGNRVETTVDGVTRALEYDAHGLYPVAEQVAPSATRTLRWEATWDLVLGQPQQVRDPSAAAIDLGYDGLGRLRQQARAGQLPHLHYRHSAAGPRPTIETFTFDGPADQVTALPASWTPASHWRHGVTVLTSAGEPMFQATRLDVDRWLVTQRQERDALGRVVTVADAYAWQGTLADLVTSALPAAVPVQHLVYDALDRPVSQTLPSGATTLTTYRPFEVTVVSDGKAPVTRLFDGQARAIHTERTVSGALEYVDARYNAAGQITQLSLPSSGTMFQHQFGYDSLGRLVSATDPDVGARTLAYDDAGRLVSQHNGAGQSIGYSYDGAGRLSALVADDGSQFTYHYDDALDPAAFTSTAGRLAWVQEPTGVVQLGYDAFGQQVRMRRTIDGRSAEQLTTRAPSGLVLQQGDGEGLELTLGYDGAGRLSALSSAAGALWQLEQQDAAGRPLRERAGNGAVQTYVRNALGQATSMQVLRPGGEAMLGLDVTYTPYGAVSSIVDTDGGGLDHSATFTYDGGARLTGAVLGAGAQAFQLGYQYDGLQNLVRREVHGPRALGVLVGQYRHGEPLTSGGVARGPRQLTSVVPDAAAGSPPGAQPVTLDYDTAGRVVRQGDRRLTYNGLDQLVAVSLGAGGSVAHAYGYDGVRVRTVDPSGATTVWFSPEVSETADGVRQLDVRVGGRLVARITRSPDAAAAAQRDDAVALGAQVARGVWWTLLGAGALAMGLLLATPGRRAAAPRLGSARRRLRAAAAAVALLTLVLGGCNSGGLAERQRALRSTSQVLYYHQTVAAGPALITRADGTIFDERRYEPFGAPIDSRRELPGGGSQAGDIDFTLDPHNALNQQTEASTGWSDHGARWLAPELARWHAPDPPVKAPAPRFMESPWELHPYQFVNQNPVLYWDPDGRDKASVAGDALGHHGLFGYELSDSAKAVLGPVFQRSWGFDVSKVRLQFGPTNGANAFTVGNTVILDRDKWDAADNIERLGLLAHEITHSVQYERMARSSTVSRGYRIIAGGILPSLLDTRPMKLLAPIPSLVHTGLDNASFFGRYFPEFNRGAAANYGVPDALKAIPIEQVNPIDKRFTLDQLADRTELEVLRMLGR